MGSTHVSYSLSISGEISLWNLQNHPRGENINDCTTVLEVPVLQCKANVTIGSSSGVFLVDRKSSVLLVDSDLESLKSGIDWIYGAIRID